MPRTITLFQFKEPKGSVGDGKQSVASVIGCGHLLNPSVFLIL